MREDRGVAAILEGFDLCHVQFKRVLTDFPRILALQTPLGRLWLAAHWDRSISKSAVSNADITRMSRELRITVAMHGAWFNALPAILAISVARNRYIMD